MKKTFFAAAAAALIAAAVPCRGEDTGEMKRVELKRLGEELAAARARVRGTSTVRAVDFLKLLPTVTVARRAPYEEMGGAESYMGLSLSTSQVWGIEDGRRRREALRAKAMRQIATGGFVIRTYIERKYLLKERLWKFSQIRRTIENPMEIAAMDERMDEMAVKIQEVEIGIERAYGEIEFACVEAER